MPTTDSPAPDPRFDRQARYISALEQLADPALPQHEPDEDRHEDEPEHGQGIGDIDQGGLSRRRRALRDRVRNGADVAILAVLTIRVRRSGVHRDRPSGAGGCFRTGAAHR